MLTEEDLQRMKRIKTVVINEMEVDPADVVWLLEKLKECHEP